MKFLFFFEEIFLRFFWVEFRSYSSIDRFKLSLLNKSGAQSNPFLGVLLLVDLSKNDLLSNPANPFTFTRGFLLLISGDLKNPYSIVKKLEVKVYGT